MLSRPCCLLLLIAALAFGQDPAATARKAVDLLLAGKYQEMEPLMTADLQKELPPANLAKLAEQFKTMGPLEKVGDPQVSKSGPNSIIVVPVKFTQRNLNLRFIVNGAGLLSLFVVQPGVVEWQRPEYSKPDTFDERPVTVGEGDWKLPGTLSVPVGAGPFPAAVLVHGSGPNDRDETVGGTKVFKDLAEGLASRGIVVLRYEKGSMQYRARVASIAKLTVQEATVEDAVKAIALLRSQPEVNGSKVFVIGHSLGAYVAPRIAEADGKLAGIVLMAGNVRPLEDLLVEQVEYMGIKGDQLERSKALQAKVKKLEPGDEDSPALGGLPVSYWLDLNDYDPAAAPRKLGIPILILHAERDSQVTTTDFALCKAAPA